MMENISNIDDFNKICKFENVVFFKFGASWCKPCKDIQPVLDEQCKNVVLFDIDIDTMSDLADDLEIQKVPTLLKYEKGICTQKYTGSNIEKVKSFFSK